MGGETEAKIPNNFHFLGVYRMGAGSGMSPTASLMKLHIQLQGGSCVDSCEAVVLVLPQWWEDVLREVNWSWKGVGSPWTVNWSWKGVG